MAEVRPLQVADQIHILAIAAQVYRQRLPQAQFNWSADALLDELQQAECLVWIDDNSKVGGFLCYRSLGDGFDITVLATADEYIKSGVQTAIMLYLQELAAAHGKSILLEVHEYNVAANRFYRKCGFARLNTRAHYYSDGAAANVLIWQSDKAGC